MREKNGGDKRERRRKRCLPARERTGERKRARLMTKINGEMALEKRRGERKNSEK